MMLLISNYGSIKNDRPWNFLMLGLKEIIQLLP